MTAPPQVRVSVVVPSFRRPARIRTCVEALAAQDHPADLLEVIVVDDGSPEPLAPMLRDVGERLDLRVHRQRNAGPAAARNAGARAATGDLIAFTDDDCEPAVSWARALAAAHVDRPTALLGGRIVNVLDDDLFAEASQQLIAALYSWYAGGGRGQFFASNNMAAPRADLLALGAFDVTFDRPGGEDRELCQRWAASARPLAAVPEAIVHHAHHMNVRQYLRQHANYGRGAHQLHAARTRAGGAGVRVESARFYAHLLRQPFRSLPFGRAMAASALIAVAQAANAAGFASQWARERGVAQLDGARARRGREEAAP